MLRPNAARRGVGTLLALAVLAGCASFRDTIFLVSRVDDQTKSRAVTDQGIALYELRVLGRQDYEALREVRRYFEVAVSLDPGNARARQYLEMIDRFRDEQLTDKTEQASTLVKKQGRSEDESYAMLLLIRQAASLSPSDPRVVELSNATEQVRAEVVSRFMDRARAAQDRIKSDEPEPQRERDLLAVKADYDRVAAIRPDYLDLGARRAALAKELDRIFGEHASETSRLIDAQRFEEAQASIDGLVALNRRIDHTHDAEVRDLSYRLNFEWAKAAYARKQTALAEARIDDALRARRSDEAIAFRDSIARARAAAAAASSRATREQVAVSEVKDLMQRGDLVAANSRINALLAAGVSPQSGQALRQQQALLRERLARLYADGVEAYRQEDFDRAVDLFTMVVEIDLGYEQASDYLDKARAKQKLLESLRSRG